MSKQRFTTKQLALLKACAADYENMDGGVLVKAMKGFHTEYSTVTAKSLEESGWLNIEENSAGEQYASFDGTQYGEWIEMNGGVDE